jgi:hypothetical protein
MPRYFFHLAGQLPATDLIGHECLNDDEALDHGSFIAHRIGTEKPEMAREENFISVVNDSNDELFKIPIASTLSKAEATMSKQDQGITRVGRGQEQPKDKERAQTVRKTEPGDTLQPLPEIKDRK